jgi:hypothetical protein
LWSKGYITRRNYTPCNFAGTSACFPGNFVMPGQTGTGIVPPDSGRTIGGGKVLGYAPAPFSVKNLQSDFS